MGVEVGVKGEGTHLPLLPSSTSLSSASFFSSILLCQGTGFAIWFTVLASHCHTRYAPFIAVPVGLWKQALWPCSVCCQEWMAQSRNASQTRGEGVSADLWTFAVLSLQAYHMKGSATARAAAGSLCVRGTARARSLRSGDCLSGHLL